MQFDDSQVEAKTASEEQDYELDKRAVDAIVAAVTDGDVARLIALMEPLHAADIADLLEQISSSDRKQLVRLYDREFDGDILSELDESIRDEVIGVMNPEVLSVAVRDLDSDELVDLLEDLDETQQQTVLDALEEPDRQAAERSLSYPEESAGRLMQREFVMAPEHWTVGDAIDFLRNSENLPDQFYHVIVVDPKLRPVGYVTLGKLMAARRTVLLRDIQEDSFRTIRVDEDEGDVAYIFNQYHLISAPVVDADERLVGVITIDDAMIVLDEEHEEDVMRLAGVGDGALSDSVMQTNKKRLPWLLVNLASAITASMVIAQFSEVIAQIIALAVLMPIVASMGGNAGNQSLAVAVRALATRDLTDSNVWRVVRREAVVGVFNGLALAFAMGLVAWYWYGAWIAVVLCAAIIINLLVAALAGILIPIGLGKLGADPALASGAFVMMVTDIIGFFAFLGIASMVLI